MNDKEVIEELVDFISSNSLWTDFLSNMEEKGYQVKEDDNSNYIEIV